MCFLSEKLKPKKSADASSCVAFTTEHYQCRAWVQPEGSLKDMTVLIWGRFKLILASGEVYVTQNIPFNELLGQIFFFPVRNAGTSQENEVEIDIFSFHPECQICLPSVPDIKYSLSSL